MGWSMRKTVLRMGWIIRWHVRRVTLSRIIVRMRTLVWITVLRLAIMILRRTVGSSLVMRWPMHAIGRVRHSRMTTWQV